MRIAVKMQQPSKRLPERVAWDNHINHAVFQQKFSACSTFWQLLVHKLFNDARAGETNQPSRFGQETFPAKRLSGACPALSSARVGTVFSGV